MRGLKLRLTYIYHSGFVASFTDAWIETLVLVLKNVKKLSHLLQMRGLKLVTMYAKVNNIVASFTDAWIETQTSAPAETAWKSHLLQMRGLKHLHQDSQSRNFLSHLLQMRGLKLNRTTAILNNRRSHLLQMRGLKPNRSQYYKSYSHVASFTDAWIETPRLRLATLMDKGRIFYRCVDWNRAVSVSILLTLSHLLQMRGLKPNQNQYYKSYSRRIFYRCVDWNWNMVSHG